MASIATMIKSVEAVVRVGRQVKTSVSKYFAAEKAIASIAGGNILDPERKTAPDGLATTAGYIQRQSDMLFLRSHPGAMRQDVQPKTSTASNYGYVWVNDVNWWNLLDEMFRRQPKLRRGSRIAASKLLRRDRIVKMVGSDQDHPRAAEIVDFIKTRVVGSDEFEYLLNVLILGCIRHGISTVETMWEATQDGYILPRRWFHCHPGQVGFDRDWTRYIVRGWSNIEKADPDKFLTATMPGLYDNPFGESSVEGLEHFFHWWKRLMVSRARVAEKFGSPLAHAEVPPGETDIDSIKDGLKRAFEQLQDDDVVITTHGEKVNWKDRSAGGSSARIQEILTDYYDGEFIKGVLGAALASEEAQFGTRAQADVHENLTLALLSPYGLVSCKAIRRQLFGAIVRLNFGEDAPVPSFEIDTEPIEDAEAAREGLKTAKELNLPVAHEEAREKLGLRSPDEGEDVIRNAKEDLDIDSGLAKMGLPVAVRSLYERYHRPEPAKGDRDLRFDDQNLYQYHLQFGVLTINEVRQSLGLPLVEWGDVPVGKDTTVAKVDGGKETLVKSGLEAAAGLDTGSQSREDGNPDAPADGGAAMGAGPGVGVAKFASGIVDQARQLEGRALDAVDAAVEATLIDGRPALLAVIRQVRDRAAALAPGGAIPADLADGIDLSRLNTDGLLIRLLLAAKLIAAMTSWAQLRLQIGTAEFADIPDDVADALASLPSGFEDAASWLANRDVLSVAQIRAMSESIAPLLGTTAESVEAELRGNILALAESVNDEITKRIGTMVSSAIDQGLSAGDFVAALDELVEAGTIPGGAEGYWANVFRTESASAYSEQQETNEKDPAIRDHLWGWEGYNPSDGRSRDSHRRIDGVRFKRGGTAALILGRSPFSYQCRCGLVPLMAANIDKAPYEESANAVAVASGIERFCQDDE